MRRPDDDREDNNNYAAPSLAWRLGGGFALAFAVLVGVFLALQAVLTDRYGGFVTQASMQGQSEDVFDGLRVDAGGALREVVLDPIDAYAYDAFYANLKYRVLDASGAVVASNEADRRPLLAEADVPLALQPGWYGVRPFDGVPLHVAVWQRELHGRTWRVQLGRSDRFAEVAREAIGPAIADTALLLGASAALLFALVAVVAVRSALRPLQQVARAAAQVRPDRLQARLPLAGVPREVRPLVLAFNATLDRLEGAFDEQQRFFANAAHELKTPLALMRAQLERDAPDRAALLHETDAAARRVQQLLQLAELGSGAPLRREPLALGNALEAALRPLAWQAERRGVHLRLLQPPAAVQRAADAGALFVLLRNLLDNAIAHSPEGGVVTLSLDAHGLAVEDSGPGVPAAERERVFERFWRAPGQQRDGAGLGLAIVREVARAHGWSVHCESAAEGGARFVVRFEPAPAGAAPGR